MLGGVRKPRPNEEVVEVDEEPVHKYVVYAVSHHSSPKGHNSLWKDEFILLDFGLALADAVA